MDLIRHLLTNTYPQERGYIPSVPLSYPEIIHTNNFVLTDKKSCKPAKDKHMPKCDTCKEDVLYVDTNTPVHVLEFETFVKQFDKTKAEFKGNRCDVLLYDINEGIECPRIVFCELTCSNALYVEPKGNLDGKRARAYQQIKNSIENLLDVFLLGETILNYPSKVGLFGWREEQYSNMSDEAVSNMTLFSITPSEESPLLYNNVYVMGHNFTFIQIKHPTHFEWNRNLPNKRQNNNQN